jgi:hypothetical protein
VAARGTLEALTLDADVALDERRTGRSRVRAGRRGGRRRRRRPRPRPARRARARCRWRWRGSSPPTSTSPWAARCAASPRSTAARRAGSRCAASTSRTPTAPARRASPAR